jgi:hypothetical protein
MPRLLIVLATLAALLVARAEAGVVVTVDKSAQRLSVSVDGYSRYEWSVSTARWGYRTPNGNYRPQWLARTWFSTKYDGSPMPHSIFFNGGYAIHGSYEIKRLGSPASHGCIRLHPENAAVLFSLVQANMRSTRIVVTGEGAPGAVTRVRGEREFIYRGRGEREFIDLGEQEYRPRVPRMRSFEKVFNAAPGAGDADLARRRWENMR